MKNKKLTHVDESGNPRMVDVSDKAVTRRTASARATILPGKEILELVKNKEVLTKKGPVFQTATIAGIMGSKRTADIIPFCHTLPLENCKLAIDVENDTIIITSEVVTTAKTGVEMEALTAVSIAALTIYDMCKAISHNIIIQDIKLMEKTGGKEDFKRA